MLRVPFLDLQLHHQPLLPEIRDAIDEVIQSAAFAGGPFVSRFEDAFAAFCHCKHAIGVGSGTEALWLALLALGVGPGDEVITVPNSFMATAEAITYCGATPVFVDVEPEGWNMDPSQLARAITPRTKAIIPVHLFGQPAEMDAIGEVAQRHGIPVVEDACQAHGAEYRGRPAGSLAAAGCFSFYPGKNLGAFGEAGAVTTDDAGLAHKIRVLRDHGQSRKYHHEMVGWNCRMDGIQAAVLQIKLRHLQTWNDQRRSHAATYNELLADCEEITLPRELPNRRHVYHIYPVRIADRDDVMRSLADRGIATGVHYPVTIHQQAAYASLGLPAGSFPVAEKAASEFLSLPMFPELTREQVHHVAVTLNQIVSQRCLAA